MLRGEFANCSAQRGELAHLSYKCPGKRLAVIRLPGH